MSCFPPPPVLSFKEQEVRASKSLLDNGLTDAVSWLEQQSHVEFRNYEVLLNECGTSKALLEGRRVHAHILKLGHQKITFLANLVLQMYGKCDRLESAREVFDHIRQPNVFSWTLMITAYSKHKQDAEALKVFRLMQLEGVKPDAFVLSTVLAVCGRTGELSLGFMVHQSIVESGMASNAVLGNALVSMYGKSGRLKDAREVFDSFMLCDAVSWNSLLAAYSQNGAPLQALRLLFVMDLEGVKLTNVTFIILLDACSNSSEAGGRSGDEKNWKLGERIYLRFLASDLRGDDGSGVEGSVVNMFGKCGRVERSREVFDGMSYKDVVAWNSMLAAYAQNGHGRSALQLLKEMDLEGVAVSRVTFLILSDACSGLGIQEPSLCDRIAASGMLESDVVVGNSVVSMHSKCGRLSSAREVFDRFGRKDVVSWNTMIAAYVHGGKLDEARRMFHGLDLEGFRPDKASFSSVLESCSLAQGRRIHLRIRSVGVEVDAVLAIALLGMYSRNKQTGEARRVLDSISGDCNVVLWNAMLAAYIQCGESKEALELRKVIDHLGLKADSTTFAHLLTACAALGEVSRGKSIHERMLAAGFPENVNVITSTALISLYSRSGDLCHARSLFEEIEEKDVVCWTAMVVAYAQQGFGKEAVDVFRAMQQEGMQPNEITFINVLFACSHSGLLEEGCYYFVSMTRDYGVVPVMDHFMCLVDLLGRVGKVVEAEDLVDNMPFHADRVAWMTVVGACTTQGDLSSGEKSARSLLKADPQMHTPYVMLKNLMKVNQD